MHVKPPRRSVYTRTPICGIGVLHHVDAREVWIPQPDLYNTNLNLFERNLVVGHKDNGWFSDIIDYCKSVKYNNFLTQFKMFVVEKSYMLGAESPYTKLVNIRQKGNFENVADQ